MKEKHIWQIAI
jgi:NIMA (never in mitosis gene a)-related kinase 1/4/5